MKKSNQAVLTAVLPALFAASALLHTGNAVAGGSDQGILQYAITITNITRGQVLAPPSIVAHDSSYQMFALGGQASPGLAQLAETPSGAQLLSEAAAQPSVYGTAISGAVIPPGASQTLYIETTKDFPEVSVATMLATTNDGFMAARNVRLPRNGTVTVEADAYDAGTEANTDTCAYAFGPPCNDLGHNPATPEGYIHVHSGVHVGGGGLDPAKHDWRNPVAQIEIKRVK